MQGCNKKAPLRGLATLIGFDVVGEAVIFAAKFDAVGAALYLGVYRAVALGYATHFLLRFRFGLALRKYRWVAVVRVLKHYIRHIAPLSLIGCFVYLYYSALTRYSPREMNNYSGDFAGVPNG